MEKRANKYRLTLELLHTATGAPETPKHLEIEVENHDELFRIIDKVKEKNPFNKDSQAIEFAIGLKLFSEVMLKNRNHELFEELGPAFGPFMKRLKNL